MAPTLHIHPPAVITITPGCVVRFSKTTRNTHLDPWVGGVGMFTWEENEMVKCCLNLSIQRAKNNEKST